MLFFFTFKNKEEKKFCAFKKNSRIFKNLNFLPKLKTFKTHFFKFLSFINLPCGHVMSHKKFGPDRFSRFDVFWIKTNRQTDRQVKIHRLSLNIFIIFCLNLLGGLFLNLLLDIILRREYRRFNPKPISRYYSKTRKS